MLSNVFLERMIVGHSPFMIQLSLDSLIHVRLKKLHQLWELDFGKFSKNAIIYVTGLMTVMLLPGTNFIARILKSRYVLGYINDAHPGRLVSIRLQ